MVDYLANSDDELTKPRVKKTKLPKVAEPKDDVTDEYEQSLPKAKKARREKSQAQLEGFKRAQEKRAQNIAKRKEEKEAAIAEKYLAKKQNQVVQPLDDPEPEPVSESSSESEEEVYVAPKKTKKVKKAPPKKKSKRKVVVYMSSSSEDESEDDDDSSSEEEQPAPKKKSRVGRQLPEIENINYRTYFA
jgi:hypothetical protein